MRWRRVRWWTCRNRSGGVKQLSVKIGMSERVLFMLNGRSWHVGTCFRILKDLEKNLFFTADVFLQFEGKHSLSAYGSVIRRYFLALVGERCFENEIVFRKDLLHFLREKTSWQKDSLSLSCR